MEYKQKKRFSALEVMIVVAVTTLVALLAYLAVPAVQRYASNMQRKNDAQAVLGALSAKMDASNGQLPSSCSGEQADCFVRNANTSQYDSQTNNVSFTKRTSVAAAINLNPGVSGDRGRLVAYNGIKCGEEGKFTAESANLGSVAAQYVIETASGYATRCIEK